MDAFLTAGVVDTMIGIRSERIVAPVPALRESEKADHHPHGYMFKEIPAATSTPRSTRRSPRWMRTASNMAC